MSNNEADSVRIAKLEQSVIGLSARMDGFGSQLNVMTEKLNVIGRPNYMLFIGIVGLTLTLIGGGYFIVQLSIKTEMAPVIAKSEISEVDRAKLNSAMTVVADRISDNRAELSKQGQQIVELETQVRATSQISNLQVSYEHTLKSILWQEMKGYALPGALYFPDVSMPKPGSTK